MPRSGLTYPIDDDWRARVEAAMNDKGLKPAQLARLMGCNRSVVADLLSGDAVVSTYVPDVHKALGWSPPVSPLLSTDEQELIKVYRALNSEGRASVKERAIVKLEDLTTRDTKR